MILECGFNLLETPMRINRQRKDRPEPGSIADAVLSTIELMSEDARVLITRQTVFQRCDFDGLQAEDIHLRLVYLQKKGYIRAKRKVPRITCFGPRFITEYELTPLDVTCNDRSSALFCDDTMRHAFA